jgi:hypothetical protein
MDTIKQKHEIDVFAPWAGGEERALRIRIHKAQIVAAARATSETNRTARDIYAIAAEVAQSWVFRRVDDISLIERVCRALCQLFLAADNIVQVDRVAER